MNAQLDGEIASCLYTGLATDTGCFKYSNTTSRTHIIAAKLMAYEFDVSGINYKLFDMKSKGRLELEQAITQGMEFFCACRPSHYRHNVKRGEILRLIDADYAVYFIHLLSAPFQIQAAASPLQTPYCPQWSMYSAVKINGKRLYDLARQGIEVERAARPVTVYSIELSDFDEEKRTGTLDIYCSKGTYIRTIISDIGKKLGTGAIMTSLCRTLYFR